jgi:hypothetical protein
MKRSLVLLVGFVLLVSTAAEAQYTPFLWGPEFSGTSRWVQDNQAIMEKTLCNINMDMVGEWLTKCQAFMCLMRTTYGNPHYINDVMENYYRYVGEGNRERVQNRSTWRRRRQSSGPSR